MLTVVLLPVVVARNFISQLHCNATMEAGQKALEDIKLALENAKVWVPIIYIPSDHISLSPEGCYDVGVTNDDNAKESNNLVDIIKLMRLSSIGKGLLQNRLKTVMKYPDNALFRFDNCKGLADENKVKDILCNASREHGTELKVRSTSKTTSPM